MKSVITKKYQVHIPAVVRKQVDFKPNSVVSVWADNNRVIIEPTENKTLKLAGTFATKKSIPAESIRKHLAYGEKK